MIQFADLIRKHAFASPGRPAVHFEGRDFTWAQFSGRCHGMAQALLDLGLAAGDRVVFLGYNSHWLAEMYFAPSIIGALCVPINHRLSEAEMVELIADCMPRVLFVDRHFKASATALMTRCPSLLHLVLADWEKPDHVLPAGTLHYDTLVEAAGTVDVEPFRNSAGKTDDTMILFYTSGTTGQPKGVMLSHANLLTNAFGVGFLYNFTAEDVVMISGPLFHLGTGSRVFSSVAYGARMVIQSRFEVDDMMRLASEQRVTMIVLVPTMLRMVLDHPDFRQFDFSSIRGLTYGAAPMPVSLIERAIEAIPAITFYQGYGMTETGPILTLLPPEYHVPGSPNLKKLTTVGRPMVYCDVRIVDEGDQPVAAGHTGEIVVRGPQVMNGYWNRPEETAHVLRSGFFHTGDAGYFDEDGYLVLAGRTKEMIISGGENVYPIETENCLYRHADVAQAAVVGLPHPHWGEEVHAVVVLHDGSRTTPADLIAFCREHIAHYKAPRGVTIWEEPLPLSPTSKIDKALLKTRILAEKVPSDGGSG